MNRIDKKKVKWQLISLTLIGCLLGVVSNEIFISLTKPTIFHLKAAVAINYKGYLGLQVDRERNSMCNFNPIRIMFASDTFNGVSMPVILPLPSNDPVWPVLGEAKFVILLIKTTDIPPGNWNIQTTFRENCHWYNSFFGNDVTVTNPTPVTIK